MSSVPLISVVMSVYNDQEHVASALNSILSQQGVDFEIIVIDDGSTDGTGPILDAYAVRDARLRVVHQENAGLTPALIRGCGLANGKYIARQDGGGDVSLPGRLQTQMAFLESHSEAVMVACGTRFIGPEGEHLHDIVQASDELQANLVDLGKSHSRGPPHHASTMFRRTDYDAVGGYRATFAVAQDQDLWLRFAEVGTCLAIPEVLFEARLTKGSISANRRREQMTMMEAALACARLRRSGSSDDCVLEKLDSASARIRRDNWIIRSISDARFYYFIGCLLRKRRARDAKVYFRRSLRAWPINPRAAVRLCLIRD